MDKTAILKKVFAEIEQRTGFSEERIRNDTHEMRYGPIVDARNEVWGRLHDEFGWSIYSIRVEFDSSHRVVKNALANWSKREAA